MQYNIFYKILIITITTKEEEEEEELYDTTCE